MKFTSTSRQISKDNREVFDDVSISSSSIYTSSVVRDCNLFNSAISNITECDNESIASTIAAAKSIGFRFPRTKLNNKAERFYAADTESFTSETEDYDILDIENRLEEITSSKSAPRKSLQEFNKDDQNNDMVQEKFHSCSKGVLPIGGKSTDEDQAHNKKLSKCFYLTLISVIGALIVLILMSTLMPTKHEMERSNDREGSLDMYPILLLDTLVPSFSPFKAATEVPTLVESMESSTETQNESPTTTLSSSPVQGVACIDDHNATLLLGNDERDCLWLAAHIASQILYCQTKYPYVYNVCKATCKSCFN
jgi:hypothetical protein